MDLPPTIVVHSNDEREWEDAQKLRIVYGCRKYRCTECGAVSPILRGDEKLAAWISAHRCPNMKATVEHGMAVANVAGAARVNFDEPTKQNEQPGSSEVGVVPDAAPAVA